MECEDTLRLLRCEAAGRQRMVAPSGGLTAIGSCRILSSPTRPTPFVGVEAPCSSVAPGVAPKPHTRLRNTGNPSLRTSSVVRWRARAQTPTVGRDSWLCLGGSTVTKRSGSFATAVVARSRAPHTLVGVKVCYPKGAVYSFGILLVTRLAPVGRFNMWGESGS